MTSCLVLWRCVCSWLSKADFPQFCLHRLYESYFSRLTTAKKKTSGSPQGTLGWPDCLLCNHKRKEGLSGGGRKVKRDWMGVCIFGAWRRPHLGKQNHPAGLHPSNRSANQDSSCILSLPVMKCLDVEEPMRRKHNNPNHLVFAGGREVKGEKMH